MAYYRDFVIRPLLLTLDELERNWRSNWFAVSQLLPSVLFPCLRGWNYALSVMRTYWVRNGRHWVQAYNTHQCMKMFHLQSIPRERALEREVSKKGQGKTGLTGHCGSGRYAGINKPYRMARMMSVGCCSKKQNSGISTSWTISVKSYSKSLRDSEFSRRSCSKPGSTLRKIERITRTWRTSVCAAVPRWGVPRKTAPAVDWSIIPYSSMRSFASTSAFSMTMPPKQWPTNNIGRRRHWLLLEISSLRSCSAMRDRRCAIAVWP